MKRVIPAAGVSLLAICSSCAMPEDEGLQGDQLSWTTQDLDLNSGAANPSGRCEGYTSGGGQRVRGDVSIQRMTSPASGGGYYLKYRINVSAENWKKNIGWNTKRTTALAIDGVIDGVPGYGLDFGNNGYLEVALGTGGNLTTKIGKSWDSGTIGPISDPGAYDFSARFSLGFYGRDGTYCDNLVQR